LDCRFFVSRHRTSLVRRNRRFNRTSLEDARCARPDHPSVPPRPGTDARRRPRSVASSPSTLRSSHVRGGESDPLHLHHPPAHGRYAIVALDQPPLTGGSFPDHGGSIMSDPLAGLPPRFLRTPEAARFLGLSGRNTARSAAAHLCARCSPRQAGTRSPACVWLPASPLSNPSCGSVDAANLVEPASTRAAPRDAQDITARGPAIGVTAARCGCSKVSVFNSSVTAADMLRDLLGPAFTHDCGGTA